MTRLRYAELFAGAGGLSLGLDRAGLVPVFHAELADWPRAMLRTHWPDVPLYGDVSQLDGRELVRQHGPLDLLSGGSPCQDLSVAGKRAGLAGARSGLFHHQARLWDETGAPYFLWENVAGALSSNAGADFAVILSTLVGATVAVPEAGWRGGGVVAGPGAVAAWRLLDAQWMGVPQRRLRVFVLAARAGACDPAEVLLEPEGVRRDPPPRREAGERSAARAGGGVASESGQGWWDAGSSVAPLRADPGGMPSHIAFDWQNSPSMGMGCRSESALDPTISFPLASDPISSVGVAQPVTGRNGDPGCVVAFDTTQVTSVANRSNPHPGDPCHPLAAQAHPPLVVCATGEVTHALTHEGADASEDGTGRGTPIVAGYFDQQRMGEYGEGGVASTLAARDYKSATDLIVTGIPRRLMPVECERLMNWPDGWTDVVNDQGKRASDAVRYKACGNGVVSAQSEWIGRRLLAVHEATMAVVSSPSERVA